MRTIFLLLSFAIISNSCVTDQDRANGRKILIYTRNGPGYVHDNISASVEALEEICQSLGIATEVTDTPAVFTEDKLAEFDGIIFSNSNNEAFTSQAQREAFQAFIRSGKGYAGIHSACASERDWPWFWAMTGGLFLRHPPLQEFDIRVVDTLHVSTAHLPNVWQWEDEPYYMHHFNPDIHVLLAADVRTIEDEQKTVYPGTTFGNYLPLAWCHQFEGGREWFTALGHKIEYYENPLFREHLKGGILWILNIQ
jgi:type 1 glutamine amidotransferase